MVIRVTRKSLMAVNTKASSTMAVKHRNMTRGHKCDYKKQIHEELLDAAVVEVITKLVANPRFAAMMQEKD